MRYIDADELTKVMFHGVAEITPFDALVDRLPNGKAMQEAYKLGWNDAVSAIMESAPSVNVVLDFMAKTPRHGKWVYHNNQFGHHWFACSSCGEIMPVPTSMGKPVYSYCPVCGAEMNEEAQDEAD